MVEDQEQELGQMIPNAEDAGQPTQKELEEVALFAIGRMRLQDIIDDSVQLLVELYKRRPESYQYDLDTNLYYINQKDSDYLDSPFVDLIGYMKEDESTRD